MTQPPPPTGWISLARAAHFLDTNVAALRRALERRARPAADGTLEAVLDGIRARKLTGRWRVLLGPEWTTMSSRPHRAPGPEKE